MYDSNVIRRINILYLVALVTPLVGCALVDSQEARQTALKAGLEAAEARGKAPELSALELTEPAVLVALMTRPIGPELMAIGPLSFKLNAQFEVIAEDQTQVKIEDSIELKIDDQGRFYLEHDTKSSALGERDRVDGRRCWWVDGQYFVGRFHGPATQVPTNGAEQNICLQSALDPLRGLLAIVGSRIKPSPKGVETLRGRSVHTIGLSQAEPEDGADAGLEFTEPVPMVSPPDVKAARSAAIWGPRALLAQDHLEVVTFDGQVQLDDVTGIPLGADLEGQLTLEKGGKEAILAVALTLAVEEGAEAIAPPKTDRRFMPRQRIFSDRAFLLGQKTLPGKGKKRPTLPSPGDAPKLALGPDGRLVAAPQKTPTPSADSSPLPQPGDAPKLVLGPNGLVQAETKDAGVTARTPVLDEDAPEAPSPSKTPGSPATAESPAPRPPMGPPVPPEKPPMGPPVPVPTQPPEDEDLPL